MRSTFILTAILLSGLSSSVLAAPILSVIPQGLQGGNWVWEVDIAPDTALSHGATPMAEEIGFRLTGDPLVSVTNLSPLVFDTNNPGNTIFGWETPYGAPAYPEGIEANCAACTVTNLALGPGHAATVVPGTSNEVFSAMGSISVAANIPFLKIVAQGPSFGGPTTSTLQWLGAYIAQGRIAQIASVNPPNPQNFDIYSGTLSQSVPEPGTVMLIGAAIATLGLRTRVARNRKA